MTTITFPEDEVLRTLCRRHQVAHPGAVHLYLLGFRRASPLGRGSSWHVRAPVVAIEGLPGTGRSHPRYYNQPVQFFWISAQESEEEARQEGPDRDDDPSTAQAAERRRQIDVVTGMDYANVVFYFIIPANAATLGTNHIEIATADQAARALGPIVGHAETVVFALGLIGAGMIAVPALAGSAAYPVAELFNWNTGLDNRLREAPGFYAVIVGAVVLGMAANFLGIDPIKGLFYTAILQGLLAPVLLLLLTC